MTKNNNDTQQSDAGVAGFFICQLKKTLGHAKDIHHVVRLRQIQFYVCPLLLEPFIGIIKCYVPVTGICTCLQWLKKGSLNR